MTFHGYRDKAMQDRLVLDGLVQGKKPRQIAAEIQVSYSTLRRRLSRHVHAIGCETLEQAVAIHTAERIKRALPLALQAQVDMVIGKKRP